MPRSLRTDVSRQDEKGWYRAQRVGYLYEVLEENISIAPLTSTYIQPTADMIAVKNLVCRTPDNGKVLFDNISFSVKKGEPLIVMGPSGSGKTSLLRVIGGLWPFEKGMLFKPSKIGRNGIFFYHNGRT